MAETNESGAINEIKALNPEEDRLMKKFAPGTKVRIKRSNGEIENDWVIRAFIRGLNTDVLSANVINEEQGKQKDINLTKLDEIN